MDNKGRLIYGSLAIAVFIVLMFAGLGYAAVAISSGNYTVSDYFPSQDTNVTWMVNFTMTGGTDNSSASINGITMPLGSTGTTATPSNWSYHSLSYKPSYLIDLSGNCTYTEIIITANALSDNATLEVLATTNYTVDNVSALPCVESYGVASIAVSSKNNSQIIATVSDYTSLNSYVSRNKNATATHDYCSVVCETSAGNVTYWMPEVSYNASHEYCPYDCMDVSRTSLKVRQIEDEGAGNVTVIIFGIVGAVIGGYLYRRRRR